MNPGIRVLLLLAAALSASCGKTPEAVIQQHRPAVEARLASIKAIAQLLPSEIVPTGAPFVLTGPPPSFGPLSSAACNAILMEEDCFAYPDPPKPGFRFSAENPIADPVSLLSRGEFHGGRPGNRELMDELLKHFTALRYVLVVRGMEVRAPVIEPRKEKKPDPFQSRTPGANADFLFTSGTCDGDLILFDLETKKSVGGFRFYGKNSPQLMVSSIDQMGYLESDLRKNTTRSIAKDFLQRYPSAVPPFDKD